MTRCPEFYENKQGIDRTLVYEHFPEGAAREITRLRDDETRLKGLNYVVGCLKRNEKVTASDLKSSIKVWLKSDEAACNVEPVSKKFTNVNSPTEQKPDPEPPIAPIAQTLKERYNPTAPDAQPVTPPAETVTVTVTPPQHPSPFKTASQVKAGIAGEMFPAAKAPEPAPIAPIPADPKKAEKERRIRLAEELITTMPNSFPGQIQDIQREHPGWNVADVFYFGVQVLHERKGRV